MKLVRLASVMSLVLLISLESRSQQKSDAPHPLHWWASFHTMVDGTPERPVISTSLLTHVPLGPQSARLNIEYPMTNRLSVQGTYGVIYRKQRHNREVSYSPEARLTLFLYFQQNRIQTRWLRMGLAAGYKRIHSQEIQPICASETWSIDLGEYVCGSWEDNPYLRKQDRWQFLLSFGRQREINGVFIGYDLVIGAQDIRTDGQGFLDNQVYEKENEIRWAIVNDMTPFIAFEVNIGLSSP